MSEENGNGKKETFEKGYQPARPAESPAGTPKPDGGYQPTQQGDSPTSTPPKGDD